MTLDPAEVPSLLRRYGIKPNKQLGQNFLIDVEVLNKITEAAEIGTSDNIIEIGPGLGQLTSIIAQKAKFVIAIELDTRFIPILKKELSSCSNIKILHEDFLQTNLLQLLEQEKIEKENYLVVANIPYYITSPLIRKLLESETPPKRLVLTLQKEIAKRITAAPGKMSLLALSVQIYGKPKILFTLPSNAFYPEPNVDSAVIVINRHTGPRIPSDQIPMFFRLAKAGFSQKRKQLRNALSAGMQWSPQYGEKILSSAGIDPKRRAETVSIEEWQTITEIVIKEIENNQLP